LHSAQGRRKSLKSVGFVPEKGLVLAKSGAIVAQMRPNPADSGSFAHPPARGEREFARGFRHFQGRGEAPAREICDKIRLPIRGVAKRGRRITAG
jgi:hypothetical protein